MGLSGWLGLSIQAQCTEPWQAPAALHGLGPFCASSEERVADIPHSPLGDSYPFLTTFSLVL